MLVFEESMGINFVVFSNSMVVFEESMGINSVVIFLSSSFVTTSVVFKESISLVFSVETVKSKSVLISLVVYSIFVVLNDPKEFESKVLLILYVSVIAEFFEVIKKFSKLVLKELFSVDGTKFSVVDR